MMSIDEVRGIAARGRRAKSVRSCAAVGALISICLPFLSWAVGGCGSVHAHYGYQVRGSISPENGQTELALQTLSVRLVAHGEPITFDLGGSAALGDSGSFVAILYNTDGSAGFAPKPPRPDIPVPDQVEITVATTECTRTIVLNIDDAAAEGGELEVVGPGLVTISLAPIVLRCE